MDRFFRENDPAQEIDGPRLEIALGKIMCGLAPQPEPVSRPRFRFPFPSLAFRRLAVGVAMLMLGLFIGRETERISPHSAEAVHPVVALAEPWDNLIVGRE